MKLKTILLLVIAACAARGQSQPTATPDFIRMLTSMERQLAQMKGEFDRVTLLEAYGRLGGKNGLRADYMTNWSNSLNGYRGDCKEFYDYHDAELKATRAAAERRGAKYTEAAFSNYYGRGMNECQATHREMLKAFKEMVDSWARQMVGREEGKSRAAWNAENIIAAAAKKKWQELCKTTHFERTNFAAGPPEPRVLGIESLTINYSRWHEEKMIASNELRRAKDEVVALEREYQSKVTAMAALNSDVMRLKTAYDAKANALSAAEQIAANGPNPVTSPEVRQNERALATVEGEIAKIAQQLRGANAATKRTLTARQRQLRSQRTRLRDLIRLQKLDIVESAKASAQGSVTRLINEKYEALKPLARAEGELRIAASAQEGLLDRYHQAVDTYDAVAGTMGKLGPEAPVITSVSASGFQATLWEPTDVLRDQDAEIRALQLMLADLHIRRHQVRGNFIRAGDEMAHQAVLLSNSQYKSMMSQFGIEAAFTAGDLAEAWAKKGTPGLLAEATKKLVENLFMPVTYADPNNLIPTTDTYWATAETLIPDTMKTKDGIKKRIIKTAVTGPATSGASYAVTSYLASRAREDYEQVARRLIRQSWLQDEASFLAAARRNFALAPLLEEKKAALLKAEKAVMGIGNWKEYASGRVSSYVTGRIKDATKSATKQALANYFEGDAWQNHNAAQAEYVSYAVLLKYTTNLYWKTDDALEYQKALKRSLLLQYDPGASMKIESRGQVSTDEDLTIELSDRGADAHRPSSREIDLFFGDVKADRLSGGRLIFRVPAAKLKTMKPKPYPIRIVVKG